MANKMSLHNRIGNSEDMLLPRVRRSRFSFHFRTPRARRWLLVQWVTAPLDSATDDSSPLVQVKTGRDRPTLNRVLDDYCNQLTARRTF